MMSTRYIVRTVSRFITSVQTRRPYYAQSETLWSGLSLPSDSAPAVNDDEPGAGRAPIPRQTRTRNIRTQSSRSSLSMFTPKTVPVSCPVSVKKTGLFEASAKIGCAVSVNVRTPVASRKRPVPPLI